ncbi:DUF1905 domain-containing protein [Candidatus Kaiserbacteria bacterium]|nr:DUF1905 domain-containing protein [Candidatus Kaiserbacteria bacterium]
MVSAKYKVRGKVWLWPGENGAWHFVHVDKKTSEIIKKTQTTPRRGFGSVRVEATIGKTRWKTSIFPDSRSGTYLLPLKASVRRTEAIGDGDVISFTLEIR